jgi:hypothetical protein
MAGAPAMGQVGAAAAGAAGAAAAAGVQLQVGRLALVRTIRDASTLNRQAVCVQAELGERRSISTCRLRALTQFMDHILEGVSARTTTHYVLSRNRGPDVPAVSSCSHQLASNTLCAAVRFSRAIPRYGWLDRTHGDKQATLSDLDVYDAPGEHAARHASPFRLRRRAVLDSCPPQRRGTYRAGIRDQLAWRNHHRALRWALWVATHRSR